MRSCSNRSPTLVFSVLCLMNLLNYIDRGIIPGAPDHFEIFIVRTLHIPVTSEGVYLGLLASSFIGSYALFCVLFGYLTISYIRRPFHLIGGGLLVWCFAVICCGLASELKSFYLLLLGRILSGIGEASFQCIAPPFIDDHAPAHRKTLYLGIFFSAIPVGMALGYLYGAMIANSPLGWKWSFYFEAMMMFPFAIYCFFVDDKNIPKNFNCESTKTKDIILDDDEPLLSSSVKWVNEQDNHSKSMISEFRTVVYSVSFILIVLGSSAYTFSIAGLSTFGPVFFLGFGLFDSAKSCSIVFGGIVVFSGTIGTPVGGWLLDRWSHLSHPSASLREKHDHRQYMAMVQMFWFSCLGTILMLLSWLTLSYKICCLLLMFFALFSLFLTTPAAAAAILLSVPSKSRPLAIAINTFVIHALGDVPSPVILGKIKDVLAPDCDTIVDKNGKIILNPKCKDDYDGLRLTLLIPYLWLIWMMIFFGSTVLYLKSKKNKASRKLRS